MKNITINHDRAHNNQELMSNLNEQLRSNKPYSMTELTVAGRSYIDKSMPEIDKK